MIPQSRTLASAENLMGQRVVLGDALEQLNSIDNESVDLLISSPPYNIGKSYERDAKRSLSEYLSWQTQIIETIASKLRNSGSVCWQVGNHVDNGELFPLDMLLFDAFRSCGLQLRNRIIWRFNFGLHHERRFSGRYETLLWFTRSDDYKFNLDSVRVPQLYPGKRHSARKGHLAGKPSGNPKGKNPSDVWEFSPSDAFYLDPVWEIPNVKAGHVEKTIHPCQFPIELAERCILALTAEGDAVFDPFVGAGASLIAAAKHGRRGVGVDKELAYVELTRSRLAQLQAGVLRSRPSGKPVQRPSCADKVARWPNEWISE